MTQPKPTLIPLISLIALPMAWTTHQAQAQCSPNDIFGDPVQTIIAGLLPMGVAIGEYSGDGVLDIAVANSGSGTFVAYRGVGDGTFGQRITLGSGAFPTNLIFADITGDGLDDLITVNDDQNIFLFNGFISIYHNAGNGILLFQETHMTQNMRPNDIRMADFDDDGILDVAVMQTDNTAIDPLSISFGLGNGLFGVPVLIPFDNQSATLAVGDINNDGILDLVVGSLGFDSITYRLGGGGGGFTDLVDIGIRPSEAIELVDMNGDGNLDIVSSSRESVGISLGHGNGAFGPAILHPLENGAMAGDLAVGDLDGDGNLDVVTANATFFRPGNTFFEGTDTLSVLFGNGDGTLGQAASYPTLGQPTSVKLGDFDADGDLDVVYSNRSDNVLQVRLNQCIVRPTIAQHPAPLTVVDAGAPVTLSVTLGEVGRPPFSFQWMRNGEPISDDGTITGAMTDTLTISQAMSTDSDVYTVVVSNESGQVTSNLGALLVRQACRADLNNDGSLNFFDVSAFLTAFSAGCP